MPEALVPPADWLLEVNNLSCGYGGDSVVKDVSFALSHGDIGCLLGPSGCCPKGQLPKGLLPQGPSALGAVDPRAQG